MKLLSRIALGAQVLAMLAGCLPTASQEDTHLDVRPLTPENERQLAKGGPEAVEALAFSADGKRLLAASRRLRTYDAARGSQLKGDPQPVLALGEKEFTADGGWLAAQQGKEIALWQTANGARAYTVTGDGDQLSDLAFSQDNRWLAWGDAEGRIEVWDLDTRRQKLRLQSMTAPPGKRCRLQVPVGIAYCAVDDLALSPDGALLVAADQSRWLKRWETKSGQPMQAVTKIRQPFGSLAYSPDGRLIAWTGDERLYVHDAATGKIRAELRGHDRFITALAFSPQSDQVASGAADRRICIWKLGPRPLPLCFYTADTVIAMAFSPDGGRLAYGTTVTGIKIVDTRTRATLVTIPAVIRPAATASPPVR